MLKVHLLDLSDVATLWIIVPPEVSQSLIFVASLDESGSTCGSMLSVLEWLESSC